MTISPNSTTFGRLASQAPDALLAIIGLHRSDPRPDKIDLGVGMYRDEGGATPIMRCIKEAERRLVASQTSKGYLGAEGDAEFTTLLANMVFGDALAGSPRLTGVQTPGGTGALRLGAELLARSQDKPEIWIGTPTWPNHAPIFQEAGLSVRVHPFFDDATGQVDFGSMVEALGEAKRGDILLLHGCCHNPTGAGLEPDQWRELVAFIAQRGLVPFVDLAYQGLGDGLDADAAFTRALISSCPDTLIAYSCDKNFGLYRERVGALWVNAANAAETSIIRQNLLVLARSLWSMPPDHGAAVTRMVLSDPELAQLWRAELTEMRERINGLRSQLAASHPRLAPIAAQRGMFAMLPLGPGDVETLRTRNGIYMASSGRINIAGLTHGNMDAFASAITPFLDRAQSSPSIVV